MAVGSGQLAVGSWQWAVGSGQVVAGSGLRALGGQVAALPYTWRWRPRHRICQPPSRNQSIPAQRTTTGASSPREGRAPARPLPPCRFRSSGSSTLPRRPAVAEDCDPPATRGDGALAIVSANRPPEISPFPRNARRRGRRRHGKSSNARMAKCKRNRKSKTMNRKFPLPTTHCPPQPANCQLPTTN